jgi:hypothetical protein
MRPRFCGEAVRPKLATTFTIRGNDVETLHVNVSE